METLPDMNMKPEDNDEGSLANGASDDDTGDTWSQESSESLVESALSTNEEQVPDDPDEAIAWLERLAAKQGARPEELPTVESELHSATAAADLTDQNDLADVDAGEIPEDPDEAMAWLEMLAAKEGATAVETKTQHESVESEILADGDNEIELVDDILTSPLTTDLVEALDDSLPDDIDQALGWLEELTLSSGSDEVVEAPLEALEVVEEPPTPAVAQVVDETLTGAELLFAQPETADDAVKIDQDETAGQYDEDDEAMAWLEQLAARQGAPIDELTTIDVGSEELTRDDASFMEAAQSGTEPDDQMIEIPPPTRPLPYLADRMPEEEVQPDKQPDESDELVEVADLESEAPPVADSPQALADADLVEQDVADEVVAGSEIGEPVMSDVEEQVLPEPAELEVAAEEEAPSGDLAWLETLGAVDAESWLEAEASVDANESVLQSAETVEEEHPLVLEALESEVQTKFEISPDSPGAEALFEARQLVEQGEINESLTQYALLVEKGENLPFLIDDLETMRERGGPEATLQRVLGDAYARNGQLSKAIERYREALANL